MKVIRQIAATRDQDHDRARVPAVAVAFFEHVLQRGHADGQERDAEDVDRRFGGLEAGLFDDSRAHDGDDDAERHVDQEDPVPVEPLDQVAADGRAEQRAGDGAEAEQGGGHAVLFARVAREQDGLRGGDDGAAAEALQRAEKHERGQVPGAAAQRAGDREEHDRAGEVAAIAEAALEPAGHRDDDDVRHHVAGRDPADLIDRRAEAGADVVQRDVDDRDVDQRHQRRHHHHEGDGLLRAGDGCVHD